MERTAWKARGGRFEPKFGYAFVTKKSHTALLNRKELFFAQYF